MIKRSIKQWPKDDRPRERLLKKGEWSLSNSELLAILLRTGVKGESAIDLARKILDKFGTFRNMSHTDMRDWSAFKGLGLAKVCQIRAALEIGRRFREDEINASRQKISSSLDIVAIVKPQIRDLKTEVFQVAYLNSSNRLIDIETIATGTVDYSLPIVREIIHSALQKFAKSFICVHNHPSGNSAPSPQDEEFTKELARAAEILQITLLDHIIIANDVYYSFADKGIFKAGMIDK